MSTFRRSIMMNKIEVDIKLLKDNSLGADDYCYLFFKFHQLDATLFFMYIDTERLEEEGWIKFSEGSYVIRNKAVKLFEEVDIPLTPEKMWEKFISIYPRRSGERRLHDKVEQNRVKFISYCVKKGEFSKIIKGLENEMELRRRAGVKREFFPDWKLMSSWINSKHWQAYVEDIEEEKDNTRVEGI